MNMDKKAMRKAGLSARRALTAAERQAKSQAIQEKLLSNQVLSKAKSIFCYVSSEDEVHTEKLLSGILSEGKVLLVPYITDAKAGLMEAAQLRQVKELVSGVYDIPTVPEVDKCFWSPADIDVVIVPGSAFDADGRRIGMGGGFYDRFLEKSSAVKVALAYDCQMFPQIPAEEYDKKVDIIFTESKIYTREDMR